MYRIVLAILAVAIASGLGTAQIGNFKPLESLAGIWKDTNSGETLEITKIGSDGKFTAVFDTECCHHDITGQIVNSNDGGGIIITRTDSKNCTNRLYGRMQQLGATAYAGGELKWELTSSQPACTMGSNHRETRHWKRP